MVSMKERIVRDLELLAKSFWNTLFPNALLKHCPLQCLNHAPILLYTGISISHNGPKPFKFEAMWTLVLTAIIFVSKIKEVKSQLIVWNKNTFGNIQDMLQQVKREHEKKKKKSKAFPPPLQAWKHIIF